MGFESMLILDLLGMYFDAAVVFVMNSSLFFRLAVAILWGILNQKNLWPTLIYHFERLLHWSGLFSPCSAKRRASDKDLRTYLLAYILTYYVIHTYIVSTSRIPKGLLLVKRPIPKFSALLGEEVVSE